MSQFARPIADLAYQGLSALPYGISFYYPYLNDNQVPVTTRPNTEAMYECALSAMEYKSSGYSLNYTVYKTGNDGFSFTVGLRDGSGLIKEESRVLTNSLSTYSLSINSGVTSGNISDLRVRVNVSGILSSGSPSFLNIGNIELEGSGFAPASYSGVIDSIDCISLSRIETTGVYQYARFKTDYSQSGFVGYDQSGVYDYGHIASFSGGYYEGLFELANFQPPYQLQYRMSKTVGGEASSGDSISVNVLLKENDIVLSSGNPSPSGGWSDYTIDYSGVIHDTSKIRAKFEVSSTGNAGLGVSFCQLRGIPYSGGRVYHRFGDISVLSTGKPLVSCSYSGSLSDVSVSSVMRVDHNGILNLSLNNIDINTASNTGPRSGSGTPIIGLISSKSIGSHQKNGQLIFTLNNIVQNLSADYNGSLDSIECGGRIMDQIFSSGSIQIGDIATSQEYFEMYSYYNMDSISIESTGLLGRSAYLQTTIEPLAYTFEYYHFVDGLFVEKSRIGDIGVSLFGGINQIGFVKAEMSITMSSSGNLVNPSIGGTL
jgi:hypothetical protein